MLWSALRITLLFLGIALNAPSAGAHGWGSPEIGSLCRKQRHPNPAGRVALVRCR